MVTRLLLVAALLSALVVSSAAATERKQPQRVGPIHLVDTGNGTTLRVWRTSEGYCVLPFRLALADRAFCVPNRVLKRSGSMFSCLCRQGRGTSLVAGIVKANVRRSEKTDRRGVAPVQLFSAPEALDTSLRFFRTVARSGSPPKWRVVVYDRSGRMAGSVGQGY